MGTAATITAAYPTLQQELQNIGLAVQPVKSKIWKPQRWLASERAPPGVHIAEDGVIVLGAPLDTPAFVESATEQALTKSRRHLELLPDLHDPQVALLLLTRCFAARPLFLLRSLPTDPCPHVPVSAT